MTGRAEPAERVFFEVADIDDPSAEYPFAVIAIHPVRRKGNGCLAVVKSLHTDRAEAALAAEAYRSGSQ